MGISIKGSTEKMDDTAETNTGRWSSDEVGFDEDSGVNQRSVKRMEMWCEGRRGTSKIQVSTVEKRRGGHASEEGKTRKCTQVGERDRERVSEVWAGVRQQSWVERCNVNVLTKTREKNSRTSRLNNRRPPVESAGHENFHPISTRWQQRRFMRA
ncbi:hypothetical protein BJ165DRAFT_1518055 [Panaeolus papilionaceus]|nr:hypothetical protein BJ165DRAFT_1518055 [Panaeolus papilionaceus]